MTGPLDARQALRSATADEHRRVDRAFSAFDLTKREDYSRFLLAQSEAFLPMEAAIDAADLHDTLPDWPARRRSAALTADLAALGVDAPAPSPIAPFAHVAEILGAIYVLEGSRLGGRILARSVAGDLPMTFLGQSDSGLWRKLIEVLDKRLVTRDQLTLAIDAARRVFALFEAGALRHEGTTKLG